MMQVRQNMIALAAAALMATGCAHGGQGPSSQAFAEDESNEPTTIRVSNNNWADINIYLVRNGARQRLGTVTSQTVEEFRLPAHAVTSSNNVHLLADPVGSMMTYRSPPIIIAPGQQMEWRLENAINLSSVWIR